MKKNKILLVSDSEFYSYAMSCLLRELGFNEIEELRLPFSKTFFMRNDISSIIYIITNKSECSGLLNAFWRLWKVTGIRQVVLCIHLAGFFKKFNGLIVLPLSSSLHSIIKSINGCFFNDVDNPINDMDLAILRPNQWLHLEMLYENQFNLSEIALKWLIPMDELYRHHIFLMRSLNVTTFSEKVAVYGMAKVILELLRPPQDILAKKIRERHSRYLACKALDNERNYCRSVSIRCQIMPDE